MIFGNKPIAFGLSACLLVYKGNSFKGKEMREKAFLFPINLLLEMHP